MLSHTVSNNIQCVSNNNIIESTSENNRLNHQLTAGTFIL